MSEETSAPEQASHKNFLIIVAVVIGLGALIALGSYLYGERETAQNTVYYNGFEFVKEDVHWFFVWQNSQVNVRVPLRYNPYEVEAVPQRGAMDQAFPQRQIYISHDPSQPNQSHTALAAAELSISLHQVFGLTPMAACTANTSAACSDKPILDCSSTNHSVILLNQSGPTGVRLAGNCVIIQGQGLEIVKATDRFLYTSLYGVMI